MYKRKPFEQCVSAAGGPFCGPTCEGCLRIYAKLPEAVEDLDAVSDVDDIGSCRNCYEPVKQEATSATPTHYELREYDSSVHDEDDYDQLDGEFNTIESYDVAWDETWIADHEDFNRYYRPVYAAEEQPAVTAVRWWSWGAGAPWVGTDRQAIFEYGIKKGWWREAEGREVLAKMFEIEPPNPSELTRHTEHVYQTSGYTKRVTETSHSVQVAVNPDALPVPKRYRIRRYEEFADSTKGLIREEIYLRLPVYFKDFSEFTKHMLVRRIIRSDLLAEFFADMYRPEDPSKPPYKYRKRDRWSADIRSQSPKTGAKDVVFNPKECGKYTFDDLPELVDEEGVRTLPAWMLQPATRDSDMRFKIYYEVVSGPSIDDDDDDVSATAPKEATVSDNKSNREEPVGVVRTGKEIILPSGMSFDEGIKWLKRRRDEDEQEVNINEVIDAYPLDGAHAFTLAMADIYGWVQAVPTPGFFGPQPPMMVGVETDVGVTVQVPWGRFNIPNVEGWVATGINWLEGGVAQFRLVGAVKQKHKAEIARLAERTREFAREKSIYKGKAISIKLPDEGEDFDPVNDAPKFIDTRGTNPADLIFPAETRQLVEYALFAPIEHTQQCREHQIPLKRGVLLEGPYGVGKTMTASVTAKKCVENGWTYIYLQDLNQLSQAIRFAKKYQPAVIFAEDIDSVGTNRNAKLNDVLNTIDGVDTKSMELIVVLTTNHVENVHPALLRPGRLDAVVPVRPPDADAVRRLITLYARGLVDLGDDLDDAARLLAGQIPAVVREVVERAKLAAITHSEPGERLMIYGGDLETAARSMLSHLELIKPKAADERSDIEKGCDSLGRQISNGLVTALGQLKSPELPSPRPVLNGNGKATTAPLLLTETEAELVTDAD